MTSHPMDGDEITVMLNRAGVRAWKENFVDMTTPERVAKLLEELKTLRPCVVELRELEAKVERQDALLTDYRRGKLHVPSFVKGFIVAWILVWTLNWIVLR